MATYGSSTYQKPPDSADRNPLGGNDSGKPAELASSKRPWAGVVSIQKGRDWFRAPLPSAGWNTGFLNGQAGENRADGAG